MNVFDHDAQPRTGATNNAARRKAALSAVGAGIILTICAALGLQAWRTSARAISPLVGVWESKGLLYGVPYHQTLYLNADGTFTASCLVGANYQEFAGRCGYANGILRLAYTNGWTEEDEITWVDRDRFNTTCLRSNVSAAVGLQMQCHRVR